MKNKIAEIKKKEWINQSEFSQIAGISRSAVTQAISSGRIVKGKKGIRWRDYLSFFKKSNSDLENSNFSSDLEKVSKKAAKKVIGYKDFEGLLMELKNNPSPARAMQIKKILEAAEKYYKAKKDKLSYEELNGSLVRLADVKKAFFEGWQVLMSSFEGWAIALGNDLAGEDNKSWPDIIKKSFQKKLVEQQKNFMLKKNK